MSLTIHKPRFQEKETMAKVGAKFLLDYKINADLYLYFDLNFSSGFSFFVVFFLKCKYC